MTTGIRKRTGTRGTAYEYRVDMGVDPVTGKRRQETGTCRTKKEAEAERRRLLTEKEHGTAIDSSKMTIAEFLPYWLDMHRHDLRSSTVQQYGSLIRAHLIPALGAIPLQKLQPLHLTTMYADKRANGRRDGTGGLAPRTVRHLHNVMHEALDFAVTHQMVIRNVADVIDAPHVARKEMTTWTPAQIQQFLAMVAGDTYDPIWLLMLTTGLRRGEALGVRWRDLDLATGRLSIAVTVIDVGGHIVISAPKTAAGRRQVRLSPACVQALAGHLQARKVIPIDGSDFVFTTGAGKPIQPRVLSRAFDVLQKKAMVPRIRLHDLRHTHATLLFNDGKNIKMISQRLGHSDVGITLSVYAHLAPDAQDEAANSIDELIFQGVQQVAVSKL